MTGAIIDFATRLRAANEHSGVAYSIAECPAKARRYNSDIGPEDEPILPTKKRWRDFRKVNCHLQFLETLRSLTHCADILKDQYGMKDCAPYAGLDRGFELLHKIEKVEVALLMTPVSRRTELDFKHHILARAGWRIKDERLAIDRVMAADEAYLKIPRQHRNRALSGKAVQS